MKRWLLLRFAVRWTSLSALMLIAVVAVVPCFLFARNVESQRSGSHLIDISGAQRMRSQKIAYFLAMAHDGTPEPDWRSEIERSIGELLEVRREVALDAGLLSGPVDTAGQTALGRHVDRFIAVTRVLERDPRDAGAFAEIRRLRPELLQGFDAAVRLRARVLAERGTRLEFALFAGLCVQLVTLMLVWARLIAPGERRLHSLLAEASAQRAEMTSLFEQNTDAISVFDRAGNLVRANAARTKLLGAQTADLSNRHYTALVAADQVEAARALFERANSGEKVGAEMRLKTTAGEPVDVAIRAFPNIVDGANAGVIVVTRDMRELRAAQALSDEMSQRIAALYEIASAHNASWQQQMADALALAAGQLGCEWGVVSEIVNDRLNVLSIFGEPIGLNVGAAIPLENALARFIIQTDDVWEVDDLGTSPWRDHNEQAGTGWVSIVAIKLSVAGVTYGTLALASATARKTALRPADRDFMKIVAALLGTTINRSHLDTKLDALAFCDSLTGLPNRVVASEKLDELIVWAQHNTTQFAVHYLDLDRFKQINDVAGHAVGDDVLRIAAKRFTQCVRSTDTVARMGGDEFVILQPSNTGRQGALDLSERVARAIGEPFVINGITYEVGCSVGISVFPDDGTDAPTLLKRADEAMYAVKVARQNGPTSGRQDLNLRLLRPKRSALPS